MIQYLALGPGGMGYFSHVGMLQCLHDQNKIEKLKEISGASAGALAGYMYILFKGEVKEMFNESIASNISKTTKIKLSSFFKNFGFIPCENVKKELSKISSKKLSKLSDPTFKELYEYNPIKLHIGAFCLTDCRTEYFSVDTHPDMKVFDAICASISVPFLFASMVIDDKIYIDGGVEEVVPLAPFLNKKQENTLAVKILTKTGGRDDIKDIKGYAGRLVHFILRNRLTYENYNILSIDITDYDIFDFKITDRQKIELFVKGYLIS